MLFDCFSRLLVQKNVPAIGLVTLCVRGFKKMHPQQCRLLLVFAGSKKCTRNVSEVTTMFAGSKNIPATVLVAPCVHGFKKSTRDVSEVAAVFMGSKIYPQQCWLLLVSAGSKKYTRNNVGYSSSLRVQKNTPVIVLVTLCVCGFKKIYP